MRSSSTTSTSTDQPPSSSDRTPVTASGSFLVSAANSVTARRTASLMLRLPLPFSSSEPVRDPPEDARLVFRVVMPCRNRLDFCPCAVANLATSPRNRIGGDRGRDCSEQRRKLDHVAHDGVRERVSP